MTGKTLIIRPGAFGLLYFLRDADGTVRPVRLTVGELERALETMPVLRQEVSA